MKMEMQESIGEKKELNLLHTSQDLKITTSYPKKVFLTF